MPKPRCSAEYLEDTLNTQPLCVGCGGFEPAGVSGRSHGKAARRMWAPIPRVESPKSSAGASPSQPPVTVDRFGRQFGGNWSAAETAAKINRADVNSDGETVTGVGGFLLDEWI